MTEESSQDIPLKLYKTAPGNHARRDNIQLTFKIAFQIAC